MTLSDKIKPKGCDDCIEVVEWTDDTIDTLIWRFPNHNAAIKKDALLIVRETQAAVLVNDGQFADVFQPGHYVLSTDNMPILTNLKGWKSDASWPLQVEVFFVNMRQIVNQCWGTTSAIVMHDREFGLVRLCAFGAYSFCIAPNPIAFIRNVMGVSGCFTSDSVAEHLRTFVTAKLANYLVKSKIAVLDFAANLNEFSSELTFALRSDFADYGIVLTSFLIENIALPVAVKEALSNRKGVERGSEKCPPLPVPHQALYHVAVGGVQRGPFPVPQLQKMAQLGEITPATLVWTAGMADWTAANSVPALSPLLGAVPPPLYNDL